MRCMVVFFIPVLLFLTACSEQIDSENITNEAIYAKMEIFSRGDGQTSIDVRLKAGGAKSNTELRMSGGEKLLVIRNYRHEIPLQEEEDVLGGVSHRAIYDGKDSDSFYQIKFIRSSEISLTATSVNMPPAFSIVLDKDSYFPNDEIITVTWDAAARGLFAIRINGDCLESYRYTLDDNGILDIPAGTLKPNTAGVSCTAELELTRTEFGNLDQGFGQGGYIRARQFRSTKIQLQF